MYKPAHHWLWDFWTLHDGEQFHLFYLQAPDQLEHAEQRHVRARIGYAKSKDLLTWEEQGEIFGPSSDAEWDSRCIWTGSVIASQHAKAEAKYALLYTGTNEAEGSEIQRIGLAWSDDFQRFRRADPSLVLEHSATHYLGRNPHHANEQAWRDPHVEYDAQRQLYWTLTTAQIDDGGRGYAAIALSESLDLKHWQVQAPYFSHPAFFLMEIPQYVRWKGYEYLLFSAMAEWIRSDYLPEVDEVLELITGTYYFFRKDSKDASEPLDWQFGGRLCGHPEIMEFGFKLIAMKNECRGMFWYGYDNMADEQSRFIGALSDPFEVLQRADGCLVVNRSMPVG